MAGSMDRCEISTTNSPGTGAGTASLVNSQSPGRGRPDGRTARRTWRLVCGTGITYPERTSVLLKARVPTAPWLTLCRKQVIEDLHITRDDSSPRQPLMGHEPIHVTETVYRHVIAAIPTPTLCIRHSNARPDSCA